MAQSQNSRLNLTEIDGYLIVNLPAVITDPLLQSHYATISTLVETSRYRGVILNLAAVSLLADISMGTVVRANLSPEQRLATVSMSLQFTGAPFAGAL